MNKNIFLILLFCCLSCDTCQQQEDINFDESYKISSYLDKNLKILTINVKLKKNFHAYGIGEKIGKPVSIEIKPDNGYAAAGEALLPKGSIKKLTKNRQSVVINGEFNIKQPLKMGSGLGKALVHMQICTASLCDRPRIHEIIFK